jgi:hypothetical protein
MSMKNSNDTVGNRSRDLPVCSAVPQPLRHRGMQKYFFEMFSEFGHAPSKISSALS